MIFGVAHHLYQVLVTELPDCPDSSNSVERVGTIGPDPMLAVAQYAIDNGMPRDRVENIIGAPLNSIARGVTLPAVVGPALIAQIFESGLGQAPAIEIAQNAPFSFLGGLERAVILAPTGRDALQALAANFAVFHDRLVPNFEETKTYTHFSFRYIGDERDNGGSNEVVLGVLVRLMRSIFDERGQPHEVQVRFQRNGVKSAYESFFQSPITFYSEDQSFGVVFKKGEMMRPQHGYDPGVFHFALSRLQKAAALRRAGSPAADYSELVNASTLCADDGVFKITAIAEKAGIGERTAQRIAQRHGSSLGKLMDEARLRLLREQLSKNPKTSAEDLSRLAGFSDSRALRRGLKSWTGQTLADFRATNNSTSDLR
ncbi:MAG: AraC family transcriptional regulator ligand-binding domain-containing protein [Pseudomonadota bacterium]